MIPLIKSEFRKLFTVRATYISFGIAVLLIIFFAFWIEGYKGMSGSAASELSPLALREIVMNSTLSSVVVSIMAVLFIGHEYRHNTIMYTLTAANSRLKVLAAKTFVLVVYATIFTILGALIAVGVYYLGLSLRDATLPAQEFNLWYDLGRIIFYGIGNAFIGMILTVLFRNIVAAIAVLFIVPGTVEGLLSLLLKDNTMYLPFTALERVVGTSMTAMPGAATLSIGHAVLLSLAYGAVAWALAAFVFMKRDAN